MPGRSMNVIDQTVMTELSDIVEKVIAEVSHRDFLARQLVNARLNGCLAMGIARRCVRMIGEAGRAEIGKLLHTEQGVIRQRLDGALAEPATMPAARAAVNKIK